jgi:NUMOD3 motif
MSMSTTSIISSSSSNKNKKGGWHHTKEARKRISQANKGRKKSPATILKIVETKRKNDVFRTARIKPVETMQKNGIYSLVGFKAANTRKRNGTDRHTEETKRKISKGASRMWVRRKHYHDGTSNSNS